jgi:hypothetical protein
VQFRPEAAGRQVEAVPVQPVNPGFKWLFPKSSGHSALANQVGGVSIDQLVDISPCLSHDLRLDKTAQDQKSFLIELFPQERLHRCFRGDSSNHDSEPDLPRHKY